MTKAIIASTKEIPLGEIVITTNAQRHVSHFAVIAALMRHRQGDWGDVPPEDARLNDDALKNGDRILSAYYSGKTRFWVITESDRSVTTILLPEDY